MNLLQTLIKISPPTQVPSKKLQRKITFESERAAREIIIGKLKITPENFIGNSINGYTTIINDKQKILFQGEYSYSKKQGFGIQYDEEGNKLYEGYYGNDKFDGWGKTSKYVGEFREGLYDGYGIYKADNIYYEGQFRKGSFGPIGVLIKSKRLDIFDSVTDIHQFLLETMQTNGLASENSPLEEIYIGQFFDGRKNGIGKLWRKNYWYCGQFSNDIIHGIGAQEFQKNQIIYVQQTIYRTGKKI